MAIHNPGAGDVMDRLTVVLLKLEKTLGVPADPVVRKSGPQAVSEVAVGTWLDELHYCIQHLPVGLEGMVEKLNELAYINRRIWHDEDELRSDSYVLSSDDPCAADRRDANIARRIRYLNDERSRLVGELNGFNDKVTP